MTGYIPHTDVTEWKPIVFDEKRGIADKQLVECWGEGYTHCRLFRFYDAINKHTYDCYGNRKGASWENYRPIPYVDYPEWAIEAEKTLED